jgi:WD40 repeat protein
VIRFPYTSRGVLASLAVTVVCAVSAAAAEHPTFTLDTTLVGHTDWVWSTAFNQDGNLLTSASWDSTVRVWDFANSRPIETLTGHTGPVLDVAFVRDADGRSVLASASNDGTVRLWQFMGEPGAEKWGHVGTIRGHMAGVWSVAAGPEVGTLVTGSEDRTLGIWRIADGSRLRTLSGHDLWIWSIATRNDNGASLLASAGEDGTLRLWNPDTGEQVRSMTSQGGKVLAVDFSPDGRLVASAATDSSICIWDVGTGDRVRMLPWETVGILSIAFSPDGRYLAAGGQDMTVHIWHVESGNLTATLSGHQGDVRAVAFSPDGHRLVSGSSDKTIRVWNIVPPVAPSSR